MDERDRIVLTERETLSYTNSSVTNTRSVVAANHGSHGSTKTRTPDGFVTSEAMFGRRLQRRIKRHLPAIMGLLVLRRRLCVNNRMPLPFDPAARQAFVGTSDVAAHFIDCGAMNVGLTLSPGERLVITDDLLNGTVGDLAAMSMAAIVSRDSQIGRAAVISLGFATSRANRNTRERYELLFELIEKETFDDSVRASIDTLIAAQFREAQINELVHELGGATAPARQRYQQFLEIVRLLEAERISQQAFLDEFVDFTCAVAGKLDFGIFAMCVDRLFISNNIPLSIKTVLFGQVLKYPPLVRKELVSGLLSSAKAPDALVEFAHTAMAGAMTGDERKEIVLVTLLKRSWQMQRAIGGTHQRAPAIL